MTNDTFGPADLFLTEIFYESNQCHSSSPFIARKSTLPSVRSPNRSHAVRHVPGLRAYVSQECRLSIFSQTVEYAILFPIDAHTVGRTADTRELARLLQGTILKSAVSFVPTISSFAIVNFSQCRSSRSGTFVLKQFGEKS